MSRGMSFQALMQEEERVVVKGGPTGDVWDIISVSGVISGF